MDNRKLDPELKKYKEEKIEEPKEESPLTGKWVEAETNTVVPEPIKEETEEDDEEMENAVEHEKKEAEEIIKLNTQPVDEEKEYLLKALEEGDKNTALYYKYKSLGLKQKEGKELTDEEKEFIKDMNQAYALDAQIEKEQQTREQEELELKEKVLQEYNIVKQADPSKIDTVPNVSKTYSGGQSIPKLLKFAFAMQKVKKKGGKVLVKVTRERKFFIEWTNKDLHFVEFFTKDEKGNLIPEITRFTEIKYTYEGTPVPVLFAIQGYAEGFDFYDKYRKDITSEMVSRIASRERHSGFLEGLNLADKKNKNNLLAMLTEFMPLILIIGFVIMAWLMWQQYGSMKEMYSAVQIMQSQMNTLVPTIDANVLVVR
jgi:hypothetical protein